MNANILSLIAGAFVFLSFSLLPMCSDKKPAGGENKEQTTENKQAADAPAEDTGVTQAEINGLWTKVLKATVSKKTVEGVSINKVNYGALKSNADFKKVYQWYESAEVPKKYADKYAFWVNAYNIYVFRLMRDKNSPASIMKIDGGAAFKTAYYKVAGKKRTLDGIEKGIIKNMGNNPDYHFAVVCGAVSCPDIIKTAYTGKNVFGAMKNNARLFFKNPGKGLRLDHSTKTVYLSTLGKWYGDEFKKWTDFRGYAATFFKGKEKTDIQNYQVKWIPYNWKSN